MGEKSYVIQKSASHFRVYNQRNRKLHFQFVHCKKEYISLISFSNSKSSKVQNARASQNCY